MAQINITQNSLVLPSRFIGATFDKSSDPELVKMLMEYANNFEAYEAQGLGPAIFGKAGAGKSHAAAALSKLLAARGIPVLWTSTVKALNLILDFRDYKAKSYFSLKETLRNHRVVVFDDFGQLRDFSRIRELFFEIIDDRYTWKKSTIFTANFTIMSEKDWINEVGQCFNVALARRIRAMTSGLVYSI